MIKVESIVTSDEEKLSKILTKLTETYRLISIMYIGLNPAMKRIYQVVLEER